MAGGARGRRRRDRGGDARPHAPVRTGVCDSERSSVSLPRQFWAAITVFAGAALAASLWAAVDPARGGLAVLLAAIALLAGGFAWLEGGTTSARDLTLVATLGGLAAAGRVLFAPIPDVQPVTVMVAAAGVALGPRRGFAVGAIAALASNFFLGQGVYTPWQMLAWGGCGVLGGLLRPLLRRRLAFAAFCVVLGFAFGTTMDTWEWFTFYPPHVGGVGHRPRSGSRVQHGARGREPRARAGGRARAAPCPRTSRAALADRGGVGVIARVLAAVAVALAVTAAAFAAPAVGPLAGAGAFLAAAQQPDGGFAENGDASDASLTSWAAFGLVASKGSADARARALTYLRQHEDAGKSDTDVALMALARLALGDRPDALLDRLRAVQPETLVNAEIWAILALRGAGEPAPPTLLRDVIGAQSRAGGWSWLRGGQPDSNDTAAALEALRVSGVGGKPVARGLVALAAFRNRDGGYALTKGRGSDAQSTAWAIQALFACGKRPGAATWRFLARLRRADGSYRYTLRYATTPVWVTAQVAPALAGRPYPLLP